MWTIIFSFPTDFPILTERQFYNEERRTINLESTLRDILEDNGSRVKAIGLSTSTQCMSLCRSYV
jgi:hypothetical protein